MRRLRSPARKTSYSGTLRSSSPSIASEVSFSFFFFSKERKYTWKIFSLLKYITEEGDFLCIHFPINILFRSFCQKLNDCETDDDVAMCFLRSKEGFQKYLQYLVGQSQAESAVSDKTVHRFFRVTPQLFVCLFLFFCCTTVVQYLICLQCYFKAVIPLVFYYSVHLLAAFHCETKRTCGKFGISFIPFLLLL